MGSQEYLLYSTAILTALFIVHNLIIIEVRTCNYNYVDLYKKNLVYVLTYKRLDLYINISTYLISIFLNEVIVHAQWPSMKAL